MAKDCQVRWDSPELSVPPATMRDDFALEAGVGDDERREFDRVAAEFTQNMIAQVRSLYVEVTGDKTGADSLTPEAMFNEIRTKVPEAVAQEAYWRLATALGSDRAHALRTEEGSWGRRIILGGCPRGR
jgi:hypothetical protein